VVGFEANRPPIDLAKLRKLTDLAESAIAPDPS